MPTYTCPDCKEKWTLDPSVTAFQCFCNNKTVNPQVTTAGVKHDQGKPPLDLLSTKALIEIAKVMDFGKTKYAAHNWRGGLAWSRVLGAAMRHITAFNDGQDTDPETGLSHLAHAGCCILFLLEFEQTHRELDDRYRQEPK